jgi:hypothetical protein
MRLIIGDEPDKGINLFSEAHPHPNYVIDTDDNYQELRIPSGYQTGLKIVHGFTISANQTTELILDFLAEKSVIVAGNGENWHLKPTVKVGRSEELSIISGKVTSDGSAAIEGAVVSAQLFDDDLDDKDKVTVHASTVTDSDGYFSLFVSPDAYNIVCYDKGMIPEYRTVHALGTGETYAFSDNDIQLKKATAGTKNLIGEIIINGVDTDYTYASLSFRQETGDGQVIEVTSAEILNGQTYDINLPLGLYSMVAWSADIRAKTVVLDVQQADIEPVENNIILP